MTDRSIRPTQMFKGNVESLHIAPAARAEMQSVREAVAVPGVGLEGDRYARRQGTFFKPKPDFELTLIEAEAVEAFVSECSVEFDASFARRNVVTRGVPLNHLVGQEFQIGSVKVKGIRLCEPCSHLEALAKKPVIKGLAHRGGLRAQILSEGVIRVGDTVSA